MKNYKKIILQSPSYGIKGACGSRITFEDRDNGIWFKNSVHGRWKLSKYKTLGEAEFSERQRTGAKKCE